MSAALEGAPPDSNLKLLRPGASGDELLLPSQLALMRSIEQPASFPLPADLDQRAQPLIELGLLERAADGAYFVPQEAKARLHRAGHIL